MKRSGRCIISIVLSVAIILTLCPMTSVFAVSVKDEVRGQLSALLNEVRPLIFKDNSEQTEKYLFDRYQRAEAVAFDSDSTADALAAAVSELENARDSLVPMKGSERVSLLSFDGITSSDLEALDEAIIGTASIDTVNKPEAARQSVSIASDGRSDYCNLIDGRIVGTSPFGVDMHDTDGLRLWVSVDAPSVLSITIGKYSAKDSFDFTIDNIPVTGEGYITLPFYIFTENSDREIDMSGLMNVFAVTCSGASKFRFADLHAYREMVDVSNRTEYSETRIMARSGVTGEGFYKIYDAASYEKGIYKAVALGPVPDETTPLWGGAIFVEDARMKFTLEDSQDGLLTQLWQFSPDPDAPNNVRIINKASACAMTMNKNGSLTYRQFDYRDEAQEFQLSASKGQFTIQVRNNGKLTVSGDTVKGTTSTTFKKFVIAKVNDGEYTQTWADEFDEPELDRSVWTPDNGFFFGGGNSAIYVDNEDTVSIKDGNLVLRTIYADNNGYQSSANQLKTNGKYAISHGKVEIRAKFNHGIGMWPALWLMPVDAMNMARSEIDLMEMAVTPSNYAEKGDAIFGEQIGTFHWSDPNGRSDWAKPVYLHTVDDVPLSGEYHTYGVEIDNDQVRMYFDGALYNVLNLVNDGIKFGYGDIPRYLIISSGGIQGDGNCVLVPQYEYNDIEMDVDYVRAYIRSEQATDDTADFTTENSAQVSSSVEYTGKRHNNFMYNFPMAVSPDGTQAIMADQAGFICVFDPRTNELLDTVSTGDFKAYLSAAYSPDGSKVAVGTMTGSILVFDTSDYSIEPLKIYNGGTITYSLVFTNDSKYIITGGFNGGAQTHGNEVNGSYVDPDYVRIFDVSSGPRDMLKKEIYVGSTPLSISVSPDGSKFAVSTTSAGIFVYNTADWSEYAHFTTEHANTITFCKFSRDGKLLASCDEAGKIVIWDVESASALRALNNVNASSVKRVDFSADGKFLVATSNDTAARIFSVESGRCVSLLGGFNGIIDDVAYSPDGNYIVAASLDHTMRVYDNKGTYLETLIQSSDLDSEGHISSRICFTPDSKYVLCTDISMPKTINRWELPTVADKTALKAAMKSYMRCDDNYLNAEKVCSLKYATPAMVYHATVALTKEPAVALFGNVGVSANAANYAAAANVFRDGWIYLTVEVSHTAGDISLVINDINGDNDRVIAAKQIRRGYEPASDGYDLWILATYLETSGEYELYFVEDVTGTKSASVTVNVNEAATTRDFKYTVNPDNTVTIDSTKIGIQNVYIPDYIDGYPVTQIADYAFANYGDSVAHMTLRLPKTLKKIGNYSFYQCATLETLELPDGLENIGSNAFARCYMLETVEIPNSVTRLGSNAFYYVRGTRYVKIGNGMKTAPSSAFSTTIGNRCFIFEEGITAIPSYVSNPARLLESIYIPKSVTSVNTNAFVSANAPLVKVYGYPGSAAEKYAAGKSNFVFVPLAAPVVSGVENGAMYDLYNGTVSASWDDGHTAYLNGKVYKKGTPITEPGEYTLKVVNGYDEFSTEVKFTVADTTPALGDADGDGEVTVSDALITLRMAANIIGYTSKELAAVDIDNDGTPTVTDALAILRVSVRLASF